MSPLWRNRILAFISPERISLRKLGGGLKPKALGSLDEPVGAPGNQVEWGATLARLDALLGQPEWQAPEIEVVLSSRLVRYAVVSLNDQLKKYAEQEAYARHVLSQLHGVAAAHWEVRIQKGHGGRPVLASAVDQALLREIRRICEARGLRLCSVSPELTAVLGRFGRAIKEEHAWLTTHEPGYSLFALFDKGVVTAVNGVSHASLTELPSLLDRENLVSGLPIPCKKAYMYSHGPHEELDGVQGGGYEWSRLVPSTSADEPEDAGMVFSAGWSRTLGMNFQRAAGQPRRAAGWMLFVAGLVLLTEMGISYARLHHERDEMLGQVRASGLRVDLSADKSDGHKLTEKDPAAARDIMSRLSAPWEDFFAGIESIKNDEVAILSMDPDAQAGALTIGGEAKSYASVLTLIAQLRRKKEFADVFLQRHEIKADDPQHPVSFSISMRWVTP